MKFLSVLLFLSLSYSITKHQLIQLSQTTGLSKINWQLIVSPRVPDQIAVNELFRALDHANLTDNLDPASKEILKEYYRVNFHQEVVKAGELIEQGKTHELIQKIAKSTQKIKETRV